jgi:hypothetical protein
MARYVPDYESFVADLKKVQRKADLFAFLLFDQRASHRAVAKFARKSFDWFDHLADASRMYVFLPIPPAEAGLENPSLQVARDLGVAPDEPPGFVFFYRYQHEMAVFFQVETVVFAETAKAEALISSLFSLGQKAQAQAKNREDVLPQVAALLRGYRRRRRVKEITDWMVAVPKEIAHLPKAFVEAFGKAMGEEFGKRVAGS